MRYPARLHKMTDTLTPGMMALSAGQTTLRYSWAPPQVTFRDLPVRALVNDAPAKNWRDGFPTNGKVSVSLLPKGNVVITMFKDDLASAPKVGEYVKRGTNQQYRIQELQEFGELHWMCLCQLASLP